MDRNLKVAPTVKRKNNPSGPAFSNRRDDGRKNPPAGSYAVSPDGHVFPASQYDPSKWHVLVIVGVEA
jgi:hypothetical protein